MAPGKILEILGSGLGPLEGVDGALDSSGRLSTVIDDTRVTFDGIPAPLLYVQEDHIRLVAPYGISGKNQVRIRVERKGEISNELLTMAREASLVILMPVARNADGTLNSPSNSAARGSVIVVYATGAGQTTPPGIDGVVASDPLPKPLLTVSVYMGRHSMNVLYAGAAPGLVSGVLQVNWRIPEDLQPGECVSFLLMVGISSAGSCVYVK